MSRPCPSRVRAPAALVLALAGLCQFAGAAHAQGAPTLPPQVRGAAGAPAPAEPDPAPLSLPSVRALTLPEALAFARSHQPAILAAQARVVAAQANAEVPRAQWLPRFGVTAQLFAATENNSTASTVVTMPEVDIPRIGGTRTTYGATASWQPYATTLVAAGGTQELFDFGRIAAQSAVADAAARTATQLASSERMNVEFAAEEAYFAVYAAKAVLTSAEAAFQRSREHRDQARAGVGSGLRSPIELTRATADLGRYHVGRVRARGNVQLAESVLAASIGSAELAVDVSDTPPQATELPSLESTLASAATTSPWLQQAMDRLREQEKQTVAIRAQMRPNLQLTGTISGRAGGAPPSSGDAATGDGWIPGVPNWDVGVLLSWPLFDGAIDARANASAKLEATRTAELEVARLTVTAAVDQAYMQIVVSRDALPALRLAVDGAVANYAQAEARFAAGLGNAVELADAENIREEAEVQLAIGEFAVARGRAELGRALAGVAAARGMNLAGAGGGS